MAPPRKLVAVDLKPDRVEALDELIADRGLGERVRLHYGVDQADSGRLAAVLDDELGDEPVGLVIDDASHRLDETRSSFETLFPRLRTGGLFVIEDTGTISIGSAEPSRPPSSIRARMSRRGSTAPRNPARRSRASSSS